MCVIRYLDCIMWNLWYYNNTKIHVIQISGNLYSIQIPQIDCYYYYAMVIICAAELKFITEYSIYIVWLSYAALKDSDEAFSHVIFVYSQQCMRISMALVREYDFRMLFYSLNCDSDC